MDFEHGFDFLDEEFQATLYDSYAEMRARCPVASGTRGGRFYALARYQDVQASAMNPKVFLSGRGVSFPPFGNEPSIPLEVDPPEHTRYRAFLQPYFSPRKVAAWEPMIRALVDSAIDTFVEKGEAELVADFCGPVPLLVMADILGLDADDVLACGQHFQHIAAAANDGAGIAMDHVLDIVQVIGTAIAERSDAPADDLLSHLVHGDFFGRTLDFVECVKIAFFFVIAGHENTTNAIANLLLYLCEHPDLRERLIVDRTLVPAACEESLRYETSTQALARTTAVDIEVSGRLIPADTPVLLLWGSANRDETVFADPDASRLDRAPNNHLGFGHGIHKCLGLHLARLEMRTALEGILDRLPDLRLAPDRPIERFHDLRLGVVELPVAFTPGRRI